MQGDQRNGGLSQLDINVQCKEEDVESEETGDKRMIPWNIIASNIEDNNQTKSRGDQGTCSIEIEVVEPCDLAKWRAGVIVFEADLIGKWGKPESPVDKQDGAQGKWKQYEESTGIGLG